MICLHCCKEIVGKPRTVKMRSYHGTTSYVVTGPDQKPNTRDFHPECADVWWSEITYALDCLDERMNSNAYFHRISGSKGIYRDEYYEHPTPVEASWNGQEARLFIPGYRFKHRRELIATITS